MNNNVFGKVDKHGMDLGQCRFPLKDEKLSDFKFSGPDACKVVTGFPFIINMFWKDKPDHIR